MKRALKILTLKGMINGEPAYLPAGSHLLPLKNNI
jgi:hypothetical protein